MASRERKRPEVGHNLSPSYSGRLRSRLAKFFVGIETKEIGIMRILITALAGVALLAIAPMQAAPAADEKKDAFLDKDLSGWEGLMKFWSYKDGALVGYTPEDPGHNTFLCSKKKYKDFELKFQIRLKDGIGNSGVQIRSKILDPKKYTVAGPQCDIGQNYWGSLYGENFGGMMKQSPGDL